MRNRWGSGGLLRDRIVESALELLEATGDEAGLTLRGVARQAEIAAPSIYDHFSGLQELVGATVAAAYGRFEEAVASSWQSVDDPRQRLHTGVAAYLAWGRESPGLYRVLFYRNHPSAVPVVGESARALFVTLTETLAAATAPASTGPSADERAVWLWVDMHGVVTLRAAHPRFAWPAEDVLVRQIVTRALSP